MRAHLLLVSNEPKNIVQSLSRDAEPEWVPSRIRVAEAARTGAGAGESGEQRSGEGRGQRDSIADGTALRCGRVGSRHFRSPEYSSPGLFVFI